VAIAARARACSGALKAFTVGGDDPALDETADAQSIARELGIEHQVVRIDAVAAQQQVHHAVDSLDQPTLDGINTFVLANAVSATGIRAVLSGTGGDELFGGYPSFRRLPRARQFAGRAWPVGSAIARTGALLAAPGKAVRWHELASSNGELLPLYRAMRGLFMPSEIEAMCGARFRDAGVTAGHNTPAFARRGGAYAEETVYGSVARLETTMYLTQQLLRDTDIASMAHGLEVRVPFVDAELVGTVWPELGNRPHLLHRKRLLRQMIETPSLHATLAKPKRTFTLPMAMWIRGPLADFTRTSMQALERDSWLNSGYSESIWSEFAAGRAHWSRVWALGVLGHYVSRH
jgi:asparagine synthase (glutamine-hydrolysing)